mmetsp:Transcript_58052/g.109365  ORF Transcript_58052/g.109365 Transcript_58052/m.109365 type:complete len:257 (+) Transcript_58052:35-805(+)
MITSAARRAASGARRAKEIRARTAETASIISGHSGAPPSVRASSTKARSSGAKFQVLWPSPPVSPPLVLRGSGTLRGYESLRIWDEDGFLLSGGKRGGHGGPSRNRGAGNNYRNGNGKKSRPPFQSINGRSFSTKAAPQADGDGDEKEKNRHPHRQNKSAPVSFGVAPFNPFFFLLYSCDGNRDEGSVAVVVLVHFGAVKAKADARRPPDPPLHPVETFSAAALSPRHTAVRALRVPCVVRAVLQRAGRGPEAQAL